MHKTFRSGDAQYVVCSVRRDHSSNTVFPLRVRLGSPELNFHRMGCTNQIRVKGWGEAVVAGAGGPINLDPERFDGAFDACQWGHCKRFGWH